MALPCEFVMVGVPVSQQSSSRRRRRWSEEVGGESERAWMSPQPFGGEVMVVITYFFDASLLEHDRMVDVDNVPKPILDGMKGVVYSDDRQVTDLLCRRRNLSLRRSPPPGYLQELRDALDRGAPFVHVLVTESPNPEVSF